MMLNLLSTVAAVEPAAVETAAEAATSALVQTTLIEKGLLTTSVGLLGVFLVLALFFVSIRAMRLIKDKDNGEN